MLDITHDSISQTHKQINIITIPDVIQFQYHSLNYRCPHRTECYSLSVYKCHRVSGVFLLQSIIITARLQLIISIYFISLQCYITKVKMKIYPHSTTV
jgi:hypothetical protein